MKLYINGQDIRRLVLANIETQSVSVHEGEPEAWLGAIDTFLSQEGVSKNEVEALYLVTGPGSPTALRTALMIANTWRTFQKMEVYTLEKPTEEDDAETIKRLDTSAKLSTDPVIIPAYSQAPKVTASKKDALGRKR